jgi:hypothetical protein
LPRYGLCLTSTESRYDGAFFSGAQRFTVAGGTFNNNFNNVINNYTSTSIVPSGRIARISRENTNLGQTSE